MESHQPVGKVFYLPDGRCFVEACPPDVDFCPNVSVSTRNDSALMDAVDAIDSDDDVVEVPTTSSSSSDTIDLDDAEPHESAAGNLLDAMNSMDTDGEELDEATTPPVRRIKLVMSGAALDLCPTFDLTNLSDTDSSTSSEESESENEDTGSEEDSDKEMDIRRIVSAPQPSSWECDRSVDQVDSIIRSQMVDIEAKKPWRFVFRCLEVPFHFKRTEDPFDIFFMRWDEFWRVHGRAVWERGFWQPLLPGSTESHRRKARQYRAMCAFREFATDLMAAMAQREDDDYCQWLGKTLHEGWWYRTEPLRLRRLFYKSRHLYEEYLVSRVKLRWPRGRKFLVERGLKPIWWLQDYSPSTPMQTEG